MQNKLEISVNSIWALCFECFHSTLEKKKRKIGGKIKRMKQIWTKRDTS